MFVTRTATYTGATRRRAAISSRVLKRIDSQSTVTPPARRANAPVERQKKVVTSRIGSSTGPNGTCPICLSAPHRHIHQAASDAAVIHIPHSSPVMKKTFGR